MSQGGLLLAPRSVLLLDGPDINIKNLRVDGALVVKAVPGARVVIDGLSVSNAGWNWVPLEQVCVSTQWLCFVCLGGGCLWGRGGGGALVVKAVPGATHCDIDGLSVSDAGWKWVPLEQVG